MIAVQLQMRMGSPERKKNSATVLRHKLDREYGRHAEGLNYPIGVDLVERPAPLSGFDGPSASPFRCLFGCARVVLGDRHAQGRCTRRKRAGFGLGSRSRAHRSTANAHGSTADGIASDTTTSGTAGAAMAEKPAIGWPIRSASTGNPPAVTRVGAPCWNDLIGLWTVSVYLEGGEFLEFPCASEHDAWAFYTARQRRLRYRADAARAAERAFGEVSGKSEYTAYAGTRGGR